MSWLRILACWARLGHRWGPWNAMRRRARKTSEGAWHLADIEVRECMRCGIQHCRETLRCIEALSR